MVTKILKHLKKVKNLSRLELEDLESFLELEMNNGKVDKKELWKKAIVFIKN